MGGHGHDEADPAVKELDANVEKSSRADDGKTAGHPGAPRGSHRHGGCCWTLRLWHAIRGSAVAEWNWRS